MAVKASSVIDLDQVSLEPVLLVKGSESALSDRILLHIRSLARAGDPQTELTELEAAGYRPGLLNMLTSPSLFGEPRLIIIDGVDQAGDALTQDLLTYITQPAPDVVIALRHRGGVSAKRVTDQVKKSGFPTLIADPLKSMPDRVRLVKDEAGRAGGLITHDAAQALVAAVGADLHEILGVTRQLVVDYGGQVDAEAVRSYFVGRVDTSGFEVADAVAAGEGPRAVVLVRRARARRWRAWR